MPDLFLVHVAASEIHAVRFFGKSDERPDWALDEAVDTGSIDIQQWDDEHVMTHVTVSTLGEQHAVRVRVSALFKELDSWADLPQEVKQEAARQMMTELLPFVRQAVYNASSQVWPVKPIMLDIGSEMNGLGSIASDTEQSDVTMGG